MFRRRLRPEGDVVAVAQRRLAALAEHHAPPPSGLAAEELPAPSNPAPSNPAPPTWELPRSEPLTSEPPMRTGDLRARHVGTRRTEVGRWGLTGQQVTVAALCLILLVVLVAWWALRSVPHPDRVTLSASRTTPSGAPIPPAPALSPGANESAATQASRSSSEVAGGPAGRVVVDVAGRVRRPGIVELPAGSRVVDAIAAAGGVRSGVALTSLNLARLLVDGEQLLVGVRAPAGGGPPPAPTQGSASPTTIAPVELNTATVEQLDTLPGIGPVTAQAIVQWRADNGPFTNVDELLEVSGIGEVTLDDLRPYVYV